MLPCVKRDIFSSTEMVFLINKSLCYKLYQKLRSLTYTMYLTFGKIQMAISPQGVVRSTSCLVLRGFFEVGGSNGAICGLTKYKMPARPPCWKIQMAISQRPMIKFTPCLVLGWGFRGRQIEWCYFRCDQIQ